MICPACFRPLADSGDLVVLGAFGRPLATVHSRCAPIAKAAVRATVQTAAETAGHAAFNFVKKSYPVLGPALDQLSGLLREARKLEG